MTAASLEGSTLDPQTLLLVRLGALVAVDAPPLSSLRNLRVAGGWGAPPMRWRASWRRSRPWWARRASSRPRAQIARAVGLAVADHAAAPVAVADGGPAAG